MDINSSTWHDRFRVSTDAGKTSYTVYDIKRPELGTKTVTKETHPVSEADFFSLWEDHPDAPSAGHDDPGTVADDDQEVD